MKRGLKGLSENWYLPLDSDHARADFLLEELAELEVGDGLGQVGEVDCAVRVFLRDVDAVFVVGGATHETLGGGVGDFNNLAETLHGWK